MSALASAGPLVRFVSVMCYFKVGNSDSDCTILQYSTYHLKVSRQSPVFIVLFPSVCSVIIRVCFSFEIQTSEMCRNEEVHFFHLEIIPVENNRLLGLTVPRFLGKTWLRDWLINARAALEGAPRCVTSSSSDGPGRLLWPAPACQKSPSRILSQATSQKDSRWPNSLSYPVKWQKRVGRRAGWGGLCFFNTRNTLLYNTPIASWTKSYGVNIHR